MRLFAYERNEHEDRWFGTRAEAQRFVKNDVPAVYRPSVKLHERLVSTEKRGVLFMLAGKPVFITTKSWTFTARGALVEITASNP